MRHWYPILGHQGAKRVRPDTPFGATSESRVTPKWGAGYAAMGGSRGNQYTKVPKGQNGPLKKVKKKIKKCFSEKQKAVRSRMQPITRRRESGSRPRTKSSRSFPLLHISSTLMRMLAKPAMSPALRLLS